MEKIDALREIVSGYKLYVANIFLDMMTRASKQDFLFNNVVVVIYILFYRIKAYIQRATNTTR